MPFAPSKAGSLGGSRETMQEHAMPADEINGEELWRIVKDVRANQDTLWKAHQDLREEFLREIQAVVPMYGQAHQDKQCHASNQQAPESKDKPCVGHAFSSMDALGQDTRARERALMSAVTFVDTPSGVSLQPRPSVIPPTGMKQGPRCPQPPTAAPLAEEMTVLTSMQADWSRGRDPETQHFQSLESTIVVADKTSSKTDVVSDKTDSKTDVVSDKSSSKDILWSVQMEAFAKLNAPAQTEAGSPLNSVARKRARKKAVADVGGLAFFWEFRFSCWDVASLLGHRQSFGPLEALANALLLSASVVVQILFIVILYRLSGTTFTDATIEGYHKWRIVTGHEVQYMDRLTEESLTTRVCSGDTSLHTSNTQAVQAKNIDAYLRKNAPFNGPMMCVLALLIWMLTVSKEFYVLMSMLRACMRLPRADTIIVVQGFSLQLRSLSPCRLAYIILLATLRAIIAGCLLVAGVKFLIVTTSIQDILLNTVALEFILEIDELLFAAWAPRQTRMLVLWMNPLPVRGRSWKGLDADLFAILLTVFGAFSVAVPVWLLPEMQRMRKARDAICGGLVGFSYAVSEVNFVAWATERRSMSPAQVWQDSKVTSRYQILRSIIENRYQSDLFAASVRTTGLQGSVWSVVGVHEMDMEVLGARMNAGCNDLAPGSAAGDVTQLGGLYYGALVSLRDSIGNQSISSCGEAAMHCNTLLYAAVRMMCPKTCGCDSPSSPLAFAFPEFGCPRPCLYQASFIFPLTTQPCVDQPTHVLVQDSSWQQLSVNFVQGASTSLPGLYVQVWESVSKMMLQSGCDAIARKEAAFPTAYWLDLCHGGWKPLAFWCPISCNCSSAIPSPNLCPTSC